MRVRWTTDAADDLERISDYIADDRPETARRISNRLIGSRCAWKMAVWRTWRHPSSIKCCPTLKLRGRAIEKGFTILSIQKVNVPRIWLLVACINS